MLKDQCSSLSRGQALKIINRKAADFDEADLDGDQQIDYEEFCLYVMPIVEGVDYTKKDLQEWWGLLDVDGDGEITKDEVCERRDRTR